VLKFYNLLVPLLALEVDDLLVMLQVVSVIVNVVFKEAVLGVTNLGGRLRMLQLLTQLHHIMVVFIALGLQLDNLLLNFLSILEVSDPLQVVLLRLLESHLFRFYFLQLLTNLDHLRLDSANLIRRAVSHLGHGEIYRVEAATAASELLLLLAES